MLTTERIFSCEEQLVKSSVVLHGKNMRAVLVSYLFSHILVRFLYLTTSYTAKDTARTLSR